MKKLLLALAFLGITSTAFAQEQQTGNFNIEYDVDSSTLTYCKVEGLGGDVFAPGIPGAGQIKTTGSTVTIDAATGSTGPFALLSVGDIIFVTKTDGTVDRRVVATKASSIQITVNTAVDWSAANAPDGVGFAFQWKKTRCGTTATDGWVSVSANGPTGIFIQFDQGDISLFSTRVVCRGGYPAAAETQIFPTCAPGSCNTEQTMTTVGLASRVAFVTVDPVFTECRVGVRFTATDTSDAGANLESVTVGIVKATVTSR